VSAPHAAFLITDMNPQPWALGAVSVGRKGGRVFPIVAPNPTLVSYQEALREDLLARGAALLEPPYALTLMFWRQVEQYRDKAGRIRTRGHADLSNLVKGTEDALQGVLIGNDRDVRKINSALVAQERGIRPVIILAVESLNEVSPAPQGRVDWEALVAAARRHSALPEGDLA
jgi:hypothetical protein